MQKIFINLTNGIEALERYGLALDAVHFVRIQSTYCENHSWDKMLQTLDSDFLMWLALGYECVVYDFGAGNETSKAAYYGLEWLKYVLERRWFGREYIPLLKGRNVVTEQFHKYYRELDKKTKRQMDYYKKFLMTEELHLTAVTAATMHDNQPEYYCEILRDKLDEKLKGQPQ
ncbi:MAG: hypothetical protein LBO69_00870 [Ignavibacteria bacterium]|jgi:hypothetical protein|nr:hypothetical protein [Ignavibacteria bacterium]